MLMFSKNKNPSFWAERIRNLKSALFHSSITQESMVATQKDSQGLEDVWNKFYAGYIKGVASTLVLQPLLEDEKKAKCEGVVDGP